MNFRVPTSDKTKLYKEQATFGPPKPVTTSTSARRRRRDGGFVSSERSENGSPGSAGSAGSPVAATTVWSRREASDVDVEQKVNHHTLVDVILRVCEKYDATPRVVAYQAHRFCIIGRHPAQAEVMKSLCIQLNVVRIRAVALLDLDDGEVPFDPSRLSTGSVVVVYCQLDDMQEAAWFFVRETTLKHQKALSPQPQAALPNAAVPKAAVPETEPDAENEKEVEAEEETNTTTARQEQQASLPSSTENSDDAQAIEEVSNLLVPQSQANAAHVRPEPRRATRSPRHLQPTPPMEPIAEEEEAEDEDKEDEEDKKENEKEEHKETQTEHDSQTLQQPQPALISDRDPPRTPQPQSPPQQQTEQRPTSSPDTSGTESGDEIVLILKAPGYEQRLKLPAMSLSPLSPLAPGSPQPALSWSTLSPRAAAVVDREVQTIKEEPAPHQTPSQQTPPQHDAISPSSSSGGHEELLTAFLERRQKSPPSYDPNAYKQYSSSLDLFKLAAMDPSEVNDMYEYNGAWHTKSPSPPTVPSPPLELRPIPQSPQFIVRGLEKGAWRQISPVTLATPTSTSSPSPSPWSNPPVLSTAGSFRGVQSAVSSPTSVSSCNRGRSVLYTYRLDLDDLPDEP